MRIYQRENSFFNYFNENLLGKFDKRALVGRAFDNNYCYLVMELKIENV